jgi:hypothetical protein
MKKFKIAIVFFGQVRGIEFFDYYKKLENNIENTEIDFFISTWDDFEYTQDWLNNFTGASIKKVSPEFTRWEEKVMFHIVNSNKLKCKYENKNNFKYECVLMTRPDILLDYKTTIPNIINFINKNENLLMIRGKVHKCKCGCKCYITGHDVVYYSTSCIIDLFCDNVKNLLNESQKFNPRPPSFIHGGHTLFGDIIGKMKIGWKMWDSSTEIRYHLYRQEYDRIPFIDNIHLPFEEMVNIINIYRRRFDYFKDGAAH